MDNRVHGDDEIHPVYTPGVARPSNVREGALRRDGPSMVTSRRRTELFVDDQSAAAEVNRLRMVAAGLEDEVAALRRRLQDSPKRVRTLEERLLESKSQLAQAVSQNEKLTYTLREAREHIATLRDEVDKLTQPPSGYGTVLGLNDDDTVDVHAGGRKMRVAVQPELLGSLERGQEVVLNESFNIVMARRPETTGEIATIKEVLEDGRRAMIVGRADEHRVVELGEGVLDGHLPVSYTHLTLPTIYSV